MFITDIAQTYLKFLYAPLMFPKMLWILIPTIWAILLMELYFDRYSREGLGHHMSLENTMFLLFISANILFISIQHPIVFPKLVLSIAFIIFSIIVGMMDFFHKLPTKLVLKGSSKFVVAFISYCTIILVYSDILLNLTILKFIYTPGHIKDHICILVEDKLFTGDLLFVGTIGGVGPRFKGSNLEEEYNSLQKIAKLSDNTEIYPGHDYGPKKSSTISYEKKHNIFLGPKTFKDFKNLLN